MNTLTFGNCSEILRANGFVAAPLGEDNAPIGPCGIQQIDHSRNPAYGTRPVAVLALCPPPRGPESPIQNARDTWLVTVAVAAKAAAVAAPIIATYVGSEKAPVRIDNEIATYVFRLTGSPFPTRTTYDGSVRVAESTFIPLHGEWREGLDLITAFRSELAELDVTRAEALVQLLDVALLAAAPPYVAPVIPPPPPILPPDGVIKWGNTRALDIIRQNGFTPLPVPFKAGAVDAFAGDRTGGIVSRMDGSTYASAPEVFDCGVGLRGLCAVSIQAGNVDVLAAVESVLVKFIGEARAVVRSASNGSKTYLFSSAGLHAAHKGPVICSRRATDGGFDPSLVAQVQFNACDPVVLSGLDRAGKVYTWNVDMLAVRLNELPGLSVWDLPRLQDSIRAVVESPPAAVATTARKRRA